MKELNTSITGVIALFIIGLSFAVIFTLILVPTHLDNTLKATVITGSIGLIGGCSAYYFTDTKRRSTTATTTEGQQIETITGA